MKKIFKEPRFQLIQMELQDGILQTTSPQNLSDTEFEDNEPLGSRQDGNIIWNL